MIISTLSSLSALSSLLQSRYSNIIAILFILQLFICIYKVSASIPTSSSTGTSAHENNQITTYVNKIKPSRPPAPLFQGSGNDFITLYMHLDPNDSKKIEILFSNDDDDNHNNNYNKRPMYEIQIEDRHKEYGDYDHDNSKDVIGQREEIMTTSNHGFVGRWKDLNENNIKLGPIVTSASRNLFPITTTIHDLSYDKVYRFRVRVSNDNGSSPWSLPSKVMETKVSVPKEPIDLKVRTKTSSSVTLSWKQNTKKPFASSFHLQYRLQVIDQGTGADGKSNPGNKLSWKDYAEDVQAMSTSSIREVQEVTTLVDDDSMITKGYFWLKLQVLYDDPALRTNVLEFKMISKPIPFNATVETFEDAIRGIRGVTNVRVFRYQPGLWGVSEKSYRGTYSWRIEFEVIGHSAPLFEIYKDNMDGDYAGGFTRCRVRRLLKGYPPVFKDEMHVVVDQLNYETFYEFRVRGANSFGYGPWSNLLSNVKTPFHDETVTPRKVTQKQLDSKHVKFDSGNRNLAANNVDPDYIPGVGMGGFDGEDGSDGLVVIIQYNRDKMIFPSRKQYYFIGRSQQYVVPGRRDMHSDNEHAVDFIDVKLWGGGGAGGGTSRNYSDHHEDGLSYGGGGGFVQTRLKVHSGEILTVQVGAGGKHCRLDERDIYPIYAGFLAGGQGGVSAMGKHGGSGGGYSSLSRDGEIIALAGGGGGGGATSYCCAHGGEGGGIFGGNGTSFETSLYIGKDTEAKGIIRYEFTAKDCESSDCIDPRDKVGLPTLHMNLDRGFAPNASYDVRSKGGEGATVEKPGSFGESGQYYVINSISGNALPGTKGLGGKGADGKAAGGGGGAGWMGGGGGGSGMDGSGGGGGSGYVDYSLVFLSEQNIQGIPGQPIAPIATHISHNLFEIRWPSNIENSDSKIGKKVRVFQVELSHGREGAANEGSKCSDEFELVDIIVFNGMEKNIHASIDGLHPNTVYCAQIVAIGDLGTSERSQRIEISTTAPPNNSWFEVYTLPDLVAINNRPDFEDVVKMKSDDLIMRCETPTRPSPRRGHSLNLIDGKIYLFGGLTKHCVCDQDYSRCKMKFIYSNEVWSFDVLTRVWKKLSGNIDDVDVPVGRENHSASRLENGKILIIGGRSSRLPHREVSNQALYLGDVWELDPGQSFSHTIKSLVAPQKIVEGSVSYHSTHVTIKNKPGFREGALCVRDISVEITLEHPCIEELVYIAIQRSNDISMEHIRRNATSEAKLFLGSSYNNNSICTSMISNITFTDHAIESILDYSTKIPSEGKFRGAEDMKSHFEGSHTDGYWVLSIYDRDIDNKSGTLLDWKLNLSVKYCNEGVQWTKLSRNSNSCEETSVSNGNVETRSCNENCERHTHPKKLFFPLNKHTSIAVGNDVFVIGGNSYQVMSEMWRFNYKTRDWTQLHSNLNRPTFYGQVASLMPFGMIAVGGIRNGIHGTSTIKDVLFYDVMNETILFLDLHFKAMTSISFIGQRNFLIDKMDVPKSENGLIFMFGGDIEIPQHGYLEDTWILTLDRLSLSKPSSETKFAFCNRILQPNDKELDSWEWSCGSLANVNSSTQCRWEDVVKKAWCLDQYQNFISPL